MREYLETFPDSGGLTRRRSWRHGSNRENGVLRNPVSHLRKDVESDIAGRCEDHAHIRRKTLQEYLPKKALLGLRRPGSQWLLHPVQHLGWSSVAQFLSVEKLMEST